MPPPTSGIEITQPGTFAFAASIVASHGGTVGARSAGPGKGSTMSIRLPAIPRAEVPA